MAIAGLARDVSGYAMAIVFVALDSIRFTEPCSKKAPRVARWRA